MPNCGETYSWLSGISYEAPDWTEKEKQEWFDYKHKWERVGKEIARQAIEFLKQNPDEMFYISPTPEEFLYWQQDITWLESLVQPKDVAKA